VANDTKTTRSLTEWLSSLPVCILLMLVVIFSTSSDIHNQVLQVGDHFWPSYYKLRKDPVPPSCDPNVNVEAQVQARLSQTSEDELGLDLFDAEPLDPEMIRASIENAKQDCISKFASYEEVKQRITPAVEAFRTMELTIAKVIGIGLVSQKFILIILIVICSITATMKTHHISLRPVVNKMDFYHSVGAQIIANTILLSSAIAFRNLAYSDGTKVEPEIALLHNVWIGSFSAMLLASIFVAFRPPKHLEPGGDAKHAGLAVPLYTSMTIFSALFFFPIGHYAGIGIYLDKLMDLAELFVGIGLYVWIGMMLKETRFAALTLNLFKPWKLSPEILTCFVVILAAVPTAYTGGSGIFVLAAGALIYHELRAAGARRQLAMAATAMSGSMGVVLRPCLLVVVVAFMNREVTTSQLYGWGFYVFLLSSTLFFILCLTVNRQQKSKLAPVSEALPQMLAAFKPLLPYILIMVGVTLFYRFVLNSHLDEFSASRILPVMMLGILIYEHLTKPTVLSDDGQTSRPHKGFEACMRHATNNTSAEIGALLLLVGCTIAFGGMVERSGVMDVFPRAFESQWTAMFMLVFVLIIMGMLMEPFGAVVLCSATIAPMAYLSGIDPVHFWMVTLVSFELGYLSPPVALNQLLARQVIGEAEIKAAALDTKGGTFYQRHERILLPLVTMVIVLLVVAFGPLIYQGV
jgi:TRAP-type C4-dicarboxylate transport system permease large subunit